MANNYFISYQDITLMTKIAQFFSRNNIKIVFFFSVLVAVLSTIISYQHGWILAYGDAESHINIAKEVVSGLTPGLAQLGGIWLPLTHLLMIPFVFFDPLWRTGIAGSILSGIFFIIACVYIFKLTNLITRNTFAAYISFLIFATNANVLYLQSTPMTEVPLLAFFILSTYYFVSYQYKKHSIPSLILAGLFAFCASLTRYDGWFLVLFEAIFIFLPGLTQRRIYNKINGETILFITLGAFGIVCWFIWCYLIFGDPFYFTDSIYSAKAQQLDWLKRHELPAYHNMLVALIYYIYTTIANSGYIIFILSIIGAIVFTASRYTKATLATLFVLFVPFIFNVISLYLGQSVIFIPSLTPKNYLFHLFNVRYGVMMMPFIAVFMGYLVSRIHWSMKSLLIVYLLLHMYIIFSGIGPVITLADGTYGLSAEKVPVNVEQFINTHYDGGFVLLDTYARTVSIAKSTIPMQKIIYVGNKPYWEISLHHPEKYATWIIMQKNDVVWNALFTNKKSKDELYTYFKKVYTSNNILIFQRISH